jgi:hypothetical protein
MATLLLMVEMKPFWTMGMEKRPPNPKPLPG